MNFLIYGEDFIFFFISALNFYYYDLDQEVHKGFGATANSGPKHVRSATVRNPGLKERASSWF